MTANRTLLAIGAGVIALVVVTLAVVLLTDDGGRTSFAPDSPEAALQAYLAALEDEDVDVAYAAFSDDVRSRVNADAFEREVGLRDAGSSDGPDTRYLVTASNVDGDTALVTVTVEEFYGDGLNGSTNRYDHEIHLVREEGAWHIDEPLVWLESAPYLEEVQ
ncbi:MAG TPA: hypothetical protein VFW95_01025 [Candidatus Limnocylindria bacterium]|nr:hypothetical protein [Candidatus Limnocylindria bacterium]